MLMSGAMQVIRGVALGLLIAATARGQDAPALRYAFKPGQTYAYEVRIEAEMPEYRELMTGQSQYVCKSVDEASGQMTLTHTSWLSPRRMFKERAGGGPPRMMPPFAGLNLAMPREVVIEPSGKVVRHGGNAQLSYLLGNVWGLLIEAMPEQPKRQWQVVREIEVSRSEDRGRWLPMPMARRETGRTARESIEYAITESKADEVVISRKYLLATAEKVEGQPALEDRGEGTVRFDLKAGVIREMDLKYTITVNEPGVSVRAPVRVTAKLLSAEELAKVQASRKAAMEKAEAARAEASAVKALPAGDLEKAIAGLKERDGFRLRAALDTLAKAAPVEGKREAVASELGKLLGDRDNFVRLSAARALKTWGTKQNVPALIEALEDRNVFTRGAAMEALGKLKDERAAEALAKQLAEFQGRGTASKALEEMGPEAEKHVIPLLNDRDWGVRMEACKILAEIGTKQSLTPLKAAAEDRNGLVKREAQSALRAIEGREK